MPTDAAAKGTGATGFGRGRAAELLELLLADELGVSALAFTGNVVFDAEQIRDTATYEDLRQLAEGVPYVLVNGTLVVDQHGLLVLSDGKTSADFQAARS